MKAIIINSNSVEVIEGKKGTNFLPDYSESTPYTIVTFETIGINALDSDNQKIKKCKN